MSTTSQPTADSYPLQAPEQHTLVRPQQESPVRVYTEWDPLEEVIVGRMDDDVRVPEWDPGLAAVIPRHARAFFQQNAGKHFPPEQVAAAAREVDHLARLLQDHGVIVRRPVKLDLRAPIHTPFFAAGGGFYSAMPRDCLLAIGDQLIEAPMAWRSRYFETFAFRPILQDYFRRGARWLAAPKPMLPEELWDPQHDPDSKVFRSVVRETEPVFDAADFIKLGRHILGQRSHVTNELGVAWLRRTLGTDFEVCVYEFDDAEPMHIDTTILPLAPGKVLVNKLWVSRLPDIFKRWDIFQPPESTLPSSHPLYLTSRWIHTNVLMLDEKRVIVEEQEEPLIQALKNWGFEPIRCPFRNFQTFGGSFHCATLDVRRRGELRSYV